MINPMGTNCQINADKEAVQEEVKEAEGVYFLFLFGGFCILFEHSIQKELDFL